MIEGSCQGGGRGEGAVGGWLPPTGAWSVRGRRLAAASSGLARVSRLALVTPAALVHLGRIFCLSGHLEGGGSSWEGAPGAFRGNCPSARRPAGMFSARLCLPV